MDRVGIYGNSITSQTVGLNSWTSFTTARFIPLVFATFFSVNSVHVYGHESG